jgi:hypothetical protein
MGTYCLGCGCELIRAIDADPNGDMGCTCARCLAEENHDFDRYPGVVFDRRGHRVEQPKPEKAKVVYIAVPSAGVFEQEGSDWVMKPAFLKVLAALHKEHPTWVFISPSAQNYLILPYLPEVGPSYADWKERCRLLLARCDILLVLPFAGWDKSIGVSDEIAMAKELKLQIITDARSEYQ